MNLWKIYDVCNNKAIGLDQMGVIYPMVSDIITPTNEGIVIDFIADTFSSIQDVEKTIDLTLKEFGIKYEERFKNMKFKMIEEDGMYVITIDDGSYLIPNALPYEQALIKLDNITKKHELICKEGFEYVENVEISNGFKRVKYLHKRVDGVDIYIINNGRVNIVGNKRFNGQDYTCNAYCDNLKDVNNNVINNLVKSIKNKIRK